MPLLAWGEESTQLWMVFSAVWRFRAVRSANCILLMPYCAYVVHCQSLPLATSGARACAVECAQRKNLSGPEQIARQGTNKINQHTTNPCNSNTPLMQGISAPGTRPL